MSTSKQKLTVFIIVCVAAGMFGAKHFLSRDSQAGEIDISSRAKGQAGAAVKITEYVDFQCPSCAYGSRLLHEYLQRNPGQIFLDVKFFPLDGHLHGWTSAKYAYCAARQDHFWPMADLLFAHQRRWQPLPADAAERYFQQLVLQTGLDPKAMEGCLEDPHVLEAIKEEKLAGQDKGIRSTPTFFINGTMVVGTNQLTAEMNKYFAPLAPAEAAADNPAQP